MEETKQHPAEENQIVFQDGVGSDFPVPHLLSMTNETPVPVRVGETKRKAGRRKIPIEFIEDKSRRQITFSKRKAGLMKKVIFVPDIMTLIVLYACGFFLLSLTFFFRLMN